MRDRFISFLLQRTADPNPLHPILMSLAPSSRRDFLKTSALLAAPLRVGTKAIGALIVLRKDVHVFTPAEEELLLALSAQVEAAVGDGAPMSNLWNLSINRSIDGLRYTPLSVGTVDPSERPRQRPSARRLRCRYRRQLRLG